MDRASALAPTVCLHGFVSHYLSLVHDRASGMARGARGIPLDYRQAGLSPAVRFLAQDLRRNLWPGCRFRDCACLRVRHELEPAVGGDGTDPGAIIDLRELYGIRTRGLLFRRADLRERSF